MENVSTTPSPKSLGNVSGDLAESFAWLNSPARIHNEIATHEAAIRAGDASPATAALLHDWRNIQSAQRRLFAEEGGQA